MECMNFYKRISLKSKKYHLARSIPKTAAIYSCFSKKKVKISDVINSYLKYEIRVRRMTKKNKDGVDLCTGSL